MFHAAKSNLRFWRRAKAPTDDIEISCSASLNAQDESIRLNISLWHWEINPRGEHKRDILNIEMEPKDARALADSILVLLTKEARRANYGGPKK